MSSSKSGSDLKVVIKANGIKGTYDPPESAEWGSGKGKATWEEPDDTSGSVSYTHLNVVLATLAGLTSLKTPEEFARLRGKSVEEIVG